MNIVEVENKIRDELEEIKTMFTPKMKLTFIARDPENELCTMIVTDDDLRSLAVTVNLYGQRETR